MDALAAKAMEVQRLAAAFKTEEAAAEITNTIPLADRVQEIGEQALQFRVSA